MKKIIYVIFLLFSNLLTSQSFNGPESVEYDSDNNRYFVSNSSNGQILECDDSGNIISVFVNNVGSGPHGLEYVGGVLYACSGGRIKGYNSIGVEILNQNLNANFLNGITHKENDLFITDFSAKRMYRYNTISGNYNIFCTFSKTPNGTYYDDINDRLLVVCWGNNAPVYELSLIDSTYSILANTNLGNIDGIAMDDCGDFYISPWSSNSIHKFNSDFSSNQIVAPGMSYPADIYYNRNDNILVVPNSGNNTVSFIQKNDCNSTFIFEENNNVIAYPNPVKNGFILFNKNFGNIKLFNNEGQLVRLQEFTSNKFNLKGLSKGVYFIDVEGEMKKVIID